MKFRFLIGLLLPLALSGCSLAGLAIGLGSTAGVTAMQERGIGGAISDNVIELKISEAMFQYHVDNLFRRVNVSVHEGRVLLTGIVDDPNARIEAVKVAWQNENVKEVINEIILSDDVTGLTTDAQDLWIAARLRSALTFDGGVSAVNYTIEVVDGTVYLLGIAQSEAELFEVVENARQIPNVRRVVSHVRVKEEDVGPIGPNPQQPLDEEPA